MVIACGLEIATDQEEIYFELLLGLQTMDVSVDRVKLPVAAAFHGNLARNRSASTLMMCGTLNSPLSNLHLLACLMAQDSRRTEPSREPWETISGISGASGIVN